MCCLFLHNGLRLSNNVCLNIKSKRAAHTVHINLTVHLHHAHILCYFGATLSRFCSKCSKCTSSMHKNCMKPPHPQPPHPVFFLILPVECLISIMQREQSREQCAEFDCKECYYHFCWHASSFSWKMHLQRDKHWQRNWKSPVNKHLEMRNWHFG